MVERLDVLTTEETARIAAEIRTLEPHWTQRNGFAPFYSLGAASYLDAARDPDAYYAGAQMVNPILREHFGWLEERVATALAKHYQMPTCFHDKFALPGFHMFLSSKTWEHPTAFIHCDLQYKHLDWSAFEGPNAPDFTKPISFTLAIELPTYGGGLRTWDIYNEEALRLSKDEMRQLFKERPMKYEAYQVGQMVLHSGHMAHQIAPSTNMQPNDARITLQGHGIVCGGQWILYW